MTERVVLDTNILVASSFNPRSSSAKILERIRAGEVEFVWDEPTRMETQRVIEMIPRLSWDVVAWLFSPEAKFNGEDPGEDFEIIIDPDDRKFAALAARADAVLVSNDEHLLSVRDRLDIQVLTPGELVRREL